MGVQNLAQHGPPQTPHSKPIPWIIIPPKLVSPGSPHSRSDTEILGDIVHEESDPMQTRQSKLANHSPPDAGNVRKRPVPTARKDEWQDSSDEGEDNNATVPNQKDSRFLSPPKKRLVTSKAPRFHKISKPKGAEAKKLSQSKTAVDFRNRREVEEAYRKKVCALIDDDILDRVDAEGGITPVGRMYKAIYRMMERRSKNKLHEANGAIHDEVIRLRAENQAMRGKIDEATQLLRSA